MKEWGFGAAVAFSMLVGCSPPAFPQKLFTIEASSADYPVMLSRASSSTASQGRPLEAKSGTHHYATDVSTGTVRYVLHDYRQSSLSASTQLTAQVHRREKWLQLNGAIFKAEDTAGYGYGSEDRNLSIKGTAYR